MDCRNNSLLSKSNTDCTKKLRRTWRGRRERERPSFEPCESLNRSTTKHHIEVGERLQLLQFTAAGKSTPDDELS
jgi:hypothetical protein